MNIAIYSRKSIDTGKGESVKNQVKLCKDYFMRQENNCKFEIFEDEGFTGGNTNRPSFQRMMELVKIKQFDVIAVYKIDRIARNIVDFVNIYDELETMGVQLVSITEGFDPRTAAGKMMMLLLASFAEMERMNIAQRVKDNMKELAKIGRWSGGTPPTGYSTIKVLEMGKKVTYLELIEDKSKDIKEMFELYSNSYSTYKISKYFKNKGLNYPIKTIQNILTNPTYLRATKESIKHLESLGYIVYGEPNGCGFLPYNRRPRIKGKKVTISSEKFVATSMHQPIVDLELWLKVHQKLEENCTNPHPRESNYSFLSGLVRCKCGSNMIIQPGHRRKNGTRIFYFRCRTKGCSKFLKVDIAEKYVFETIKQYLDKEYLKRCLKSNKKDVDVDIEIKQIDKKISLNNKAIDNLVDKLTLLSNDASLFITKKIEELSVINRNLKEDLLILERKKLINNLNDNNVDVLHNQIMQFVYLDDDIALKKKYIKTIVKSVIWDSENNTIKIELLK
ncbi:recombinase family protein [Abyssisolibacter fermentans]|uniref:recombinase family protein n=1 Tax=Abyssisolibacter fermentans TaxID=1766203 RepID=UPI00082DBAAA|nr:recombinase family protein [Abyssisolibacter fermentans]